MTEAEMQALHDIYRAEILLCKLRGDDAREIAYALDRYAGANGMTVHAAALAVLARGPTEDGPLRPTNAYGPLRPTNA